MVNENIAIQTTRECIHAEAHKLSSPSRGSTKGLRNPTLPRKGLGEGQKGSNEAIGQWPTVGRGPKGWPEVGRGPRRLDGWLAAGQGPRGLADNLTASQRLDRAHRTDEWLDRARRGLTDGA